HGLERVSLSSTAVGAAPPSAAATDAALTGAALRFASALAGGVVDPVDLHEVYTLEEPPADLAAPLAAAIADGKLGGWLASLAPQDRDYAILAKAYQEAAKAAPAASKATDTRLPTSGLIRAGDSDDRVPALARQLADGGYLAPEARSPAPSSAPSPSGADPSHLYTARLSEAVKRLQEEYGLASDGVVGPATLEVLNIRPADRARALAVALERRRWQARNPPATRIDVNVAVARLDYYRDGTRVDSRKVIVGKPGTETPQLMSPIYRLVANPTWTIPKSIENREMANVSARYLKSRNMVRKDGFIVQQPGPDNALGLVKFDMLNDQAIYLHDTSAPTLFDRSQRHLSHGCVRVADAPGFAKMLAEDQGIAAEWQQAQDGRKTTFVTLPQKLPVRLLYRNAFVDDQGEVAIRTDPYGWNGPVAKALGFGEGSALRARIKAVDVTP
ncbi:MAG: L,D-transpeptidase family protein, partial [Sphingomonadaceae bacterium]|nr:L,D-transpeptidase family protein [Sphingomonadaceae bacterium]